MQQKVWNFFRAAVSCAFLLGAFLVIVAPLNTPVAKAAAGINQQINFQGRLYNAAGAVVPDGNYNIQFKIYQDGDGVTAGNTTGTPAGSLKWTENYLNSSTQGVAVVNGFMSVQLGSITPFGNSVDWNQSTLWLSINIGSTNGTCTPFASCTPDGEMLPMKRLSATPYALNAGQLGGLSAAGFIQNTTTLQTANVAVQSAGAASIAALIQGAASQTADIFQVKANGTTTPLLAVSASGNVMLQPKTDSNGAFVVKNSLGNNIFTVDTANSRVGIGLGGSTQPAVTGTGLQVQGALRLSGSGVLANDTDTFITPLGASVATKINIPLYDPGASGQVIALGLPSTANSTARGLTVLDGRTAAHQPTLAVLSPNENNVFGFSWDGSNTIGYVKNTANDIALQGGGMNTLLARNVSGVANVGIGNAATSGYALDVTGDINSSSQYRIGGNVTLTSSALTFSNASTSTVSAANSQILALQGGNATVGNTNGGNVTLSGGTGFGTGVSGLVVFNTPTFSTTANDPNCYTGGSLVATSCTIAVNSVNNSAAILAGFSVTGQSATLPDPTILTAGRVVYVTAANASQDFTLIVNGGGTGNSIAMRQNTTATMIWNGSDWTAAGASSSTTLQSAYDNTLQSAGGAELLVSKTSTTNGLTIRDSSTAPVNGTILSVQTASAAGLFSVNGTVTEYATNAGAETVGSGGATSFPANTWSSLTGGTVTRYATAGNYIATGQASAQTVTTATANAGLKNTLNTSLNANMSYNVSFTTRLLIGSFTDMNVYYSVDGTAASVPCTLTAVSTTSVWTKVNCTFAAPASGITATNAILIRQTAATARTFYVDNLSVTIAADYNYATDGRVNDATNFTTNWTTAGLGTVAVSRNSTDGNDASDSAQAVVSAGAANAGLRNKLSINPIVNTLYRISVYAKLSTGTFTDFKVRYSRDGSTTAGGNYVDCVDYNTQIVTTTGWTQITCYITTDAIAPSNPYVYFAETTSAARTFSVDTFSMTLSSNTAPNVQIGGGINGGPTTLLTLDKGASAPIASNNDALLGSMYYDTTLGKLQCYESDGWGACGSSPDNIITISPEYTNAVLHGTGIGTMVSDICSSTLNINDGTAGQPTICGVNETYNFYKWTSPQLTAQTYSIFVTYQLPGSFKSFASGQTSIKGRTDSTNATVNYQVYKSDASTGLTACGSPVAVSTGSVSSWQTGVASGTADPSTCGFIPGNSIVFKVNAIASSNANAYIGNLNFTFSNR